MAEVVVAPKLPAAPVDWNATLTAVVVAEDRLEIVNGVVVAAARVEVAETVPNVGEVVAERVNV